MRKIFLLLALALSAPCSLFAQGSAAAGSPVAVNQAGTPLPYTLVTVCTTNPGTGTCASEVTTYTDITVSHACSGSLEPLNNSLNPTFGAGCSNPGYTDALGNVVVYASTGAYWCQYSGPGITTYSQPCVFPGISNGITGATANGGLQQTGTTLGLLTSCSVPQVEIYNGTAWVCGSQIPITTVAGLASVLGKTNGSLAEVNNGASTTDCSVGGGSTPVLCQYNGSSWGAIAASTSFSGLTSGTNSNAAMVVGSTSGTNASLVPAGVGQITGITNWYSPGGAGLFAFVPATTISSSGGTLVSGSHEYIQITINQGANTSLPSMELNLSLTGGTGCTGSSCSVTVTAPTLLGSETYTVYSSTSSGSEKQQTASAACVAITTNCVIGTSGTGASPPSTNTAAGVTPSPVAHTSDCRPGLNPLFWVQDANRNWEQGACVDTTMVNNNFTERGFLNFSRPVLFNMSGIDPAGSTGFSYNGVLNVYQRPNASLPGNPLAVQILTDDAPGDVATYSNGFRGVYSEIDINGLPFSGGIDNGAQALRGTTAVLTPSGSFSSWGPFVGVGGFAQRASGSGALLGSCAFTCYVGVQGTVGDQGTGSSFQSFAAVSGLANSSGAAGGWGASFVAVNPSSYFPQGDYAYFIPVSWTAGANRWGWGNDSTLASYTNGPWYVNTIGPSNAGQETIVAPLTGMTSVTIPSQLATPGVPAVGQGGTPGSTSYSYRVVAKDGNGDPSAANVGAQTTVTGNATLTSTNFNQITITCPPGVASYDIYRTASSGTPSTTGKIGNTATILFQGGGSLCTFKDTGLAGDGTTPPAVNQTGAVNAFRFETNTNCAVNSASPAACGSAAAGAVVVPTTTTTYTVNTAAVTVHSRITLTWLSFAADLPSSPTCVAPAATSVPTISAISAGVSFTITLPSTTGQTCPQFTILN
jgi:hypothetical protein